jgi:hypothetical protein
MLSSISQVELHTQALRYFFCAPLKAERITLRKNNGRLPTEGMITPNRDVEVIHPDLAGDHRSELASRSAFFDHRSNPDCPMHHQCIETRKIALKDFLQFSRNWQSIISVSRHDASKHNPRRNRGGNGGGEQMDGARQGGLGVAPRTCGTE